MQTIEIDVFDAVPSSKGRPSCDRFDQFLNPDTAFVLVKGQDYDIEAGNGRLSRKWDTEYQNLVNAAKRKGVKISYKTVTDFKIGDDLVAKCVLVKVAKG